MKKLLSIAILLALLLSVISVYACDRTECIYIKSTPIIISDSERYYHYDCGCPAYSCKCAECENCKYQFIEEASAPNAYLEPNYYPDYDVAPAPMPAPEKAPKTGDFSMLPQLMLAVAAAGSLVVASKRAK